MARRFALDVSPLRESVSYRALWIGQIVSLLGSQIRYIAAVPYQVFRITGSVNLMVVTGGPRLGDVEAGIAASLVGAPESVVVGGVARLLGTAGVAAGFPSLRRYRARRHSH